MESKDYSEQDENYSHISLKRKTKKPLLRLIVILLSIVILVVGTMGTLDFFNIVNISFASKIFLKPTISIKHGKTTFSNGDITYSPTKESISYDATSNIIYFNNLIVVYTFDCLSNDDAENLSKTIDGKLVGKISGSINVLQILVNESNIDELNAMADSLMKSKKVLYASYDYPVELKPTVTDENPWNKDGEGFEADRGNENKPDGNDWWAEAIGAYTAWSYCNMTEPINVGIIDNGFSTKHSDLRGQISFLNNFSQNTEEKHGTHVAGIIAAKNNNIGIRGIANGTKLICADFSPKGKLRGINYLSTGEYIEITKQMIENNAKVINNSWGNYFLSAEGYANEVYKDTVYDWAFSKQKKTNAVVDTGAYESYVKYSESFSKRTALECSIMIIQLLLNDNDDFLIVQAAGNGYDNSGPGVDAKYSSFYCGIDESVYNILSEETRTALNNRNITYQDVKNHVIIVGAVGKETDKNGNYKMSYFSNHGENVDICAPGENIYSTVNNKKGFLKKKNNYEYETMCGTSMAAPMVTGSVALLWSLAPSLSAKDIRDIIIKNVSTEAINDITHDKYPMLNVGMSVKAIIDGKNTAIQDCSENELRAKIHERVYKPVLHFFYDDYDADGTHEAFAIVGTADTDKGWYSEADLWFVNSYGVSKLKEGIYGYPNGVLNDKKYSFLSLEKSAHGSGSFSYIFGVKNGNPIEMNISEQYGDFSVDENHVFKGYTSDFSDGRHNYICTEFVFDDESYQFYKRDAYEQSKLQVTSNGNTTNQFPSNDVTPFKQKYWIIFTEGYRSNRLEASTIDSVVSPDNLKFVWDKSVVLNNGSESVKCDQYYLDNNNNWIKIGEYGILTDYATHIIASNLDVVDVNGNIILKKPIIR